VPEFDLANGSPSPLYLPSRPEPLVYRLATLLVALCLPPLPGLAQSNASLPEAPERARGEGPYDRLVIRGATLIDGTGAPPRGPVDIVIEGGSAHRVTLSTRSYTGKPHGFEKLRKGVC